MIMRKILELQEVLTKDTNNVRIQLSEKLGQLKAAVAIIEEYIPKTLEATTINELIEKKVHFSQEDLTNKVNNLNKSINKQFGDLHRNHLSKEGFVGPQEEYTTLISYTAEHIPKMTQKMRKAADDAV